jgi:hypothetical protein
MVLIFGTVWRLLSGYAVRRDGMSENIGRAMAFQF